MKESAIVTKALNRVRAKSPTDATVRTSGGDDPISLPQAILEWETERVDDHGANPFAGVVRNSDGDVIGEVKHLYFQMDLRFELSSESELQAIDLGDAIQRAFLAYEDDPSKFHRHTYEWDIGSMKPQHNPAMEPDWYENVLSISFRFMKEEIETDVETLKQIDYNISSE